MNRKDILDKIILEQNKVIASLQQSVDQYRTASDIDEESTHDSEDYTNQSIAKDMQLRFEKMMNAVSYTHLDVYKRQPLEEPSI